MTTVDKEDSINYWEDRYEVERKLFRAMQDDRMALQMKFNLMKHNSKKWHSMANDLQIMLKDERQIRQHIMMYRDFLSDLYGI